MLFPEENWSPGAMWEAVGQGEPNIPIPNPMAQAQAPGGPAFGGPQPMQPPQQPMQQPMQQQPGMFGQAMNTPGASMAGAALQNLVNTSLGQYGKQVDPIQAYQQSVQNRAIMDQRMRTLKIQEEAAKRENEPKPFGGKETGYYVKDDTAEGGYRRIVEPEAKTGPFEGTAMEAQMFNLVANPDIPWSDPNKQAAAASLTKPKTIATPEGTMVIPGNDLSMYGYGGGGGQTGTLPGGTPGPGGVTVFDKQLTEGQVNNRGFFKSAVEANTNLSELEAQGVAIPTPAIGLYLKHQDSPMAATIVQQFMSPEQQRYLQLIMESGMIKLRDESGAALGKEEIATQLRQFIVSTSDSPEIKADKQKRRQLAIDKYFEGGGKWSPEEQEAYELMKRQWTTPAEPPPPVETPPAVTPPAQDVPWFMR